MSVVLKNVLHSHCRQGKMPDFNVKRFFALSRDTKSPISSKRRDEGNTTLTVCISQCCDALTVYTKRRGFIVSLTHLLFRRLAMPVFR